MKKLTNTERRLIQEYVRLVLLEDEGGGEGGGGASFDSIGGVHTGQGFTWGKIDTDFKQSGIYKAFVKPFVDVIQTAAGEGQKTLVRARGAVKTAFEVVKSVVLPFYSTKYKQIFDEQDKLLDTIEKKYEDVYRSTDKALWENNDFIFFAFISNPTAFVTTQFFRKAPGAVTGIIGTLLGEEPNIGKITKFLDGVYEHEAPNVVSKYASQYFNRHAWIDVHDSHSRSGATLLEADDATAQKVDKVLAYVQQKVSSSKRAQSMMSDATAFIDRDVAALLQPAREAASIKDLSKFPQLKAEAAKLPQEVQQEFLQVSLQQIRAAAVNACVSAIKKRREQLAGAGVNSNLLAKYDAAVQSITSGAK